MEQLATGGVLHGGSYNALPAAMAAVVATLSELKKTGNLQPGLERQGKKLMTGIEQALAAANIEAQVQGFLSNLSRRSGCYRYPILQLSGFPSSRQRTLCQLYNRSTFSRCPRARTRGLVPLHCPRRYGN